MSLKRIFVNFADQDGVGRVRIHDVFQPFGSLAESDLMAGRRVLLDDERGKVVPAILVFNDWSGDWLADPEDNQDLALA